jgi:phosphoglycerate transport regulatory protein PgtC
MNDKPSFSAIRRRLLLGLGAGGLMSTPLRAAETRSVRQPVVVLTSYNDEVFSRFEAAFEKAHPQYKLQLVWRMPHDALPYLRQPRQAGVDVYWSASPRNFAALAREGAWQPLGIARDGLPERIGKARLADAEGFYTATEMAGYGFIFNPEAVARLKLAAPADWQDLTAPAYAGQLVLPNPARVGFAPVMVDIVLQAYGWEKGWATWSAIAGNAGSLTDRGSTFVTDEVASGRRAVGLSIDFFAVSAIANGAPLRFAYPAHGGINPAHIALARNAPNPDGARAFASFVLSAEGQRIVTHRDIHKLPVRPEVYRELPADYFNPFRAAEQGAFDYDGDADRNRLGLISALFEQTLIREHGELAALWQRIHRAAAAGHDIRAARQLLESPPISLAEASQPALQQVFRNRLEGANPDANDQELRWQEASRSRRAAVASLLTGQGA